VIGNRYHLLREWSKLSSDKSMQGLNMQIIALLLPQEQILVNTGRSIRYERRKRATKEDR
jgi:hypothetical protein